MTATMEQPGLWDLPEPEPVKRKTPRPPIHTPRPRRSKEAQALECAPSCLVCGKAEGRGLCSPRCSVVCSHVAQPDTAEVCVVSVHVTAILVTGMPGSTPGRKIAFVACPYCGEIHWHAPTFGVHYRTAPCGTPYIVHLARPRIAPWEAP